jgi:hypothetical protein
MKDESEELVPDSHSPFIILPLRILGVCERIVNGICFFDGFSYFSVREFPDRGRAKALTGSSKNSGKLLLPRVCERLYNEVILNNKTFHYGMSN